MRRGLSDGDRRFRRRWLWATTVGWFAGFLLGFVAASLAGPLVGIGPLQSVLAYFVLGVSLGSMVGLMQLRALRERLSKTGSWVMSSAAGLGVAGGAGYGAAVLAFGYSEGLEGLGSVAAVFGWTLAVAFGGAVTGVLQWRVLRRHVSRAGWWVSASSLGWGLSMAVAGTVMAVGSRAVVDPPMIYVATLFVGGLLAGGTVLGAVTGAAVVWLLMQPIPEA